MMRAIPQVNAVPAFRPPAIRRHRLANGLDLMIVTRRGLPVFDAQLITRGGAAVDPPRLAGRASLTAEMLDEGTHRRSALEISSAVELLGADLDLRAGWDACYFSMHGLTPQLDPILDLLAEVALEPSFPAGEFDRKHEERLHALAQERDEPRTVAVKSLATAVFGADHPYGRPLGGTLETVQRMSPADIAAYYSGWFAPAAAHLILVGDLDEDSVIRAVDARMGGWQPGEPDAAAANGSPSQRANPPRIYLIDRPGAAQSEVRAGHVGVARHTPDYFALLVLNTILGGSFKSRLNMKLREEKGFTYGASSGFSFRRAGGAFTAGTAVSTDATVETVAIIAEEIERMRDEPVSAEELVRARNYLAIGFMRNFETTADITAHLASMALYDLPLDYLGEYPERIENVTASDVLAAAQRHLHPEELSVVVVGDAVQVEEPLSGTRLGPVQRTEAE